LSPFLFTFYGEYLINGTVDSCGNFEVGGKVIHSVKNVDDLVLLAMEEAVLQGMIERLIEI